MIGSLLLGSAVVCHTVAVVSFEVSAFAVEQAVKLAVEKGVASVAWVVAFVVTCDVRVAYAGVEMFAVVDTAAAGLITTALLVLAV